MRKIYLFLMMLFVQLITCSNIFAADPPRAEYDAAMAAISEGVYYISTEVDGVSYYVNADGGLEEDKDFAALFTITKTGGGALYTNGLRIDNGAGKRFTNPGLTNNTATLTQDFYATTDNDRTDWERQVPYMNAETGLMAIRSCNTAFGTSSWADAGRTFWTYTIDDVEGWVTPCFSYDPAYIWTFELPEDNVQITYILEKFEADYRDQMYDFGDGEDVNIGSDFGQYADTKTWNTLWELLQEVGAYYDQWIINGGDYDPTQDPDALTLDQIKDMREQADSLWQVVLDSEVPYTPENGYYRIFTAERYKSKYDETGYVDKAIAASYYPDHENKGVYATLDRDKANFIWELTVQGDSVLLKNVAMGTYISKSSLDEDHIIMTEDVNDAGCYVFDYAGLHDVEYGIAEGTETEERHVFAMRPASEPRGGSYIHQQEHGTPNQDGASPFGYYQTDTGVEQELRFWIRTYNRADASDNWTSEWYLEPVSEDEVTALLAGFDDLKDHDVLVDMNNKLRAEVLDALTTAKDYIRTAQITSVNQLSSPNSDPDEGQHLEYLIDGATNTFWHTSWHGENQEPNMAWGDGNYHYLQISGMDDLSGDCELYWVERDADNDRPTKVVLVGSNDPEAEDEAWEDIVTLTIPNTGKLDVNTIPFTVANAYSNIRIFAIDKNNGFSSDRLFWHAAEIQLYTVRMNPTSQFASLGDIAEELDNTYEANVATPDEQITQEIYDALLAAYRAFMGALVDPTELRAALAAYKNTTVGVVEGNEPGQWSDASIAEDFNTLYGEVEDYDKSGRYTAAQHHEYSVMLKAMNKSVMEKANGVNTDTWYRIMVPTEEMYDAYGFDKSGVGKSTLIEEQAYQFGYFAAPGKKVTLEVPDPTDDDPDHVTNQTHVEPVLAEEIREGVLDNGSMFFFDDADIEEQAISEYRFIEREAEEADYSAPLQDAKENMQLAFDLGGVTYTRGNKLITDGSQYSSNASYPGNDGQKLETGCLCDDNFGTYWHSDYGRTFCCVPYLQVALNEPVSGLIQVYVGRRNTNNGHVVRMYVQGSNDAENWTNIGYIETPFTNVSTPTYSQPLDLDGTYSHLRFSMTNRYGTDGGSNIEFDPFAEGITGDDYNTKYTYFHCSEFQIYPLTLDAQPSAEIQALLDTYKTANKVVLKDATAEDLAATAGAYRAYRATYNAAAGKDILPYGKDKADPIYAIQNKATGLLLNCKGGNNANNSLELIPTFFDLKPLGYERMLIHGKNINGGDCTYLHTQNFDHRFVTWNATTPASNSGLVLRIAEAVEADAPAFSFYKDIKPGQIYGWTNSVTIAPSQDGEGEMGVAYTLLGRYVDNEEESFLALKEVETIPAGEPAIFIYSDLEDYDAEDNYVEPMLFNIPTDSELAVKGNTTNGLIGCIVNTDLAPRHLYFDGNKIECVGEEGYYQGAGDVIVDLDITPTIDDNTDYDFLIALGEAGDKADGVKDIASSVEKISQRGNVYSMDGRLLMTGATLNNLKTLGRGMYILNGVKVLVK